MNVWKLSHGNNEIDSDQSDWLDKNSYVTVHKATKKLQGENFINQVSVGDIVCLSRSGDVKALVKITSDILEVENKYFESDWVFRQCEVIHKLPSLKTYEGEKKGWTPNYNGTLFQVPKKELRSFETLLLKKHFQCTLESIGITGNGNTSDDFFQWIEKCRASAAFEKFLSRGINKTILDDAIRVIHGSRPNFDLWNVDYELSALRFGNKDPSQMKGKVAGSFKYRSGGVVVSFSKAYGRGAPYLIPLDNNLQNNEKLIIEHLDKDFVIFEKNNLIGKKRWPSEYKLEEVSEPSEENKMSISTPLNQILYGPPGTGKTYNTIEKAVMAAEPTFLPTGKNKDELRSAYKAIYDELVVSDRIRFVTFHQSYGYEEFVEGLSAKTEADKLSYYEKDGVFKIICDDAKRNLRDSQKSATELNGEYKFNEALESFKLSMFDDADVYPLTEACSILVIESDGFRYGGNWNSFPIMKFEDLKLLYSEGVDSRQGIKNSANVSGLAKQHASYFIRTLEAIKKHIPKNVASPVIAKKQNYVLIIDEINRGNISKIFGELITLIESSKRFGQRECIEVTLPHSGKPFSVPDNLYIIGTMNTADRSLALMDTALRRRFDFVEMMPDYSVLKDDENQPYCIQHSDNQIDLVALLSTLNKRISALYDREHTLGHAFLIPVIDEIKANNHPGALTELANCFKNRLIPLLAEYFFENWQKIRLVLGDNQKQKSVQLIQETEVDFESLFGDTEDLDIMDDETKDYQLIKTDSALWQNPLTYIGIYNPSDVGE